MTGSVHRSTAVRAVPALAAGLLLTVAAAGCSSGGGASASATHSAAPSPSAPAATHLLGAHSLPAQTNQTLPAFPTYYDAHKDTVVVTDAYPKSAAQAYHANFAPSLSAVQPASQPSWYIVRGKAAPGQLAVLGSEPGEDNYSPLWRTVIVTWKPGVTPKLLTSDDMIHSLAQKGELTANPTSFVVNAPVVAMP
jgi:hypothetical protein